ncbi:hypothetical protein PENSPDRAFT_651814 [Peniophora sp. CONT]|nr:hypothetical protein PENSPDRAFT_651814 [Peniophora sp. CONT]
MLSARILQTHGHAFRCFGKDRAVHIYLHVNTISGLSLRGYVRRSSSTVDPSSQRPSRAAKEHPKGDKCKNCSSLYSTGKWYKHPEGGPICQSCYSFRKFAEAESNGTTCLDCGRGTTGSRWYGHPSGKGARCQRCVDHERMRRNTLAGRFCQDCGSKQTSHWYLHPSGDGSSMCLPCYIPEKLRRDALAGRVCKDCRTTKTSRWLLHPSGDGSFRCHACYMKERRAKSRERAATATVEVKEAGHPRLARPVSAGGSGEY